MKKWIKIGLFTGSLMLYFWFVLSSQNMSGAITKILIVALLLLGMETSRRDREKVFVLHSNVEQLKNMETREFVEYVAQLYKRLGYFIDLLKSKEDLGCDLIARKKRDVICIKCISGEEEVDLLPLQEVYGSLNLYRANKGMIVTTGTYTERAKQFARGNKLELVGQERLIRQIAKVINEKEITTATTQKV